MSGEGEQKNPAEEKAAETQIKVKQNKVASVLAAVAVFLEKSVSNLSEESTRSFVELFKMTLLLQVKALVRSTLADLRYKSASDFPNLALLNVKLACSNPAFIRKKEKGQEIQRWFIGEYIGGLLNSVKVNDQIDASIKGFAWHFLATDATNFLKENGQIVNQEWLSDKMGPLIITSDDSKAIKHELSRFSQGDPEVIRKL